MLISTWAVNSPRSLWGNARAVTTILPSYRGDCYPSTTCPETFGRRLLDEPLHQSVE
jgi:hypothetical protein